MSVPIYLLLQLDNLILPYRRIIYRHCHLNYIMTYDNTHNINNHIFLGDRNSSNRHTRRVCGVGNDIAHTATETKNLGSEVRHI